MEESKKTEKLRVLADIAKVTVGAAVGIYLFYSVHVFKPHVFHAQDTNFYGGEFLCVEGEGCIEGAVIKAKAINVHSDNDLTEGKNKDYFIKSGSVFREVYTLDGKIMEDCEFVPGSGLFCQDPNKK